MNDQKIKDIAARFLKKEWTEVTELEKRIIQKIAEKRTVSLAP